jgi:hypothetical protein
MHSGPPSPLSAHPSRWVKLNGSAIPVDESGGTATFGERILEAVENNLQVDAWAAAQFIGHIGGTRRTDTFLLRTFRHLGL